MKTNIEKRLLLIAWDQVCMPKVKGGLGLCKTEVVNKAFQWKFAWKVLTKIVYGQKDQEPNAYIKMTS